MSPDGQLTIAQINAHDTGGGAAGVAAALHRHYRRLGHRSVLIVGHKQSDGPDVVELDNRRRGIGWRRGLRSLERRLGWQDMDYPGIGQAARRLAREVDVVHLHNLHGDYFDLSALPVLARHARVVMTPHDMWPMTGHCAHALACSRWQEGCGQCPDLARYPSVSVDGTRFNWRRKRHYLRRARPHLIALSGWMRRQLDAGLLAGCPTSLIPNGIDLDVFRPGPKQIARRRLGLPAAGAIVLFSADRGPRNPYKDFASLADAVRILHHRLASGQRPTLVALGGDEGSGYELGLPGRVVVRGYQSDPSTVAAYYQAADVLAFATRADTCPLTVMEAAACGLPVVATEVGGVPDLVEPGRTGWLVPAGDPKALADRLHRMLTDSASRTYMGWCARQVAIERFGVDRMVQAHLRLYADLAGKRRGGRHAA